MDPLSASESERQLAGEVSGEYDELVPKLLKNAVYFADPSAGVRLIEANMARSFSQYIADFVWPPGRVASDVWKGRSWALEFTLEHRELARVALLITSLPCSEAVAERLFSTFKQAFDSQRMSAKENYMRAILIIRMCRKFWGRSIKREVGIPRGGWERDQGAGCAPGGAGSGGHSIVTASCRHCTRNSACGEP
jgi:hypothetical protein